MWEISLLARLLFTSDELFCSVKLVELHIDIRYINFSIGISSGKGPCDKNAHKVNITFF
jgi:hypothetical protein